LEEISRTRTMIKNCIDAYNRFLLCIVCRVSNMTFPVPITMPTVLEREEEDVLWANLSLP